MGGFLRHGRGALLAAGCLAVAEGGHLYFTDRGASSVHRSAWDGSGAVALLEAGDIPGSNNLRGIAVDPRHGWLYFCDNGEDAIFRVAMGGGTPVPIVEDLGFPADLTLDPVADRIYWCDRDRDVIQRAGLDGSGVETVLEADEPYFLHVDAARDALVWGDFADGNIFSARLSDGGDRRTLVSGITGRVRGVEPDYESGWLYWINRNGDSSATEDAKVQRRRLEGGPIEDLYTGLDTPHGMVLDRAAGKIYWADTGSNAGSGLGGSAVSRGEMDGRGPQEILWTGSQPWDVVIDPTPHDYANWRGRHFLRGSADAEAGPQADPDMDTVVNLLEFAQGLPPRVRRLEELPALVHPPGHPGAGLRFRRLVGVAHGLDYRPEAGHSPGVWDGDALIEIVPALPVAEGVEELVVGFPPGLPPPPEQYFRLRVILAAGAGG